METSITRIRKINANNPLKNILGYMFAEGTAIAGEVILSESPAPGKGFPICNCRFDKLEDNNIIEIKVTERKIRTMRFVLLVIVYSLKGLSVNMTSYFSLWKYFPFSFPSAFITKETEI